VGTYNATLTWSKPSAYDHSPEEQYLGQGEFAIQEIHGNLETLGTAQQNRYRENTLFDINS